MNTQKILKQISTHRLLIIFVSPFIIYLIVAYLLWGPSNFTDIHRDIFTPSGDPLVSVWYLRWWPFSLGHGLNPIFERYAYYPNGFDLAWSTSIPTLAFIMVPVTAIWGALTSFNVLALVALPLSALSCYYLIYYLTKKYWASVLCGFIYGFSSFQLAELLGHNCFYVSFVPPLVVLAILMRIRGNRLGKIPFIIILAVLLAMQFGIATEGFGTLYLFGAAAWVLSYIFANKKLRLKLFATTIEMAWATLLTLIILSPFIYYLIRGYSGVPKNINPPVGYSADLLNYIVPTKITFLGGHLFENVSKNFTGNPSEQGAYLSIPLILFIVGYGIYNWRNWYSKVLVIMSALIGLASLGPKLQVNGKITFVLPWDIATYLPVLRSMLPTRFPMYIFLLASIMLGLWLSDKSKATKKKQSRAKYILASKYGLVILIIVLLLPATSNYFWANPNIPPLFTPKLTKEYIGSDKNILILPLSDGADPEFWQVTSGMNFRTTDGYLGFVPNFVINSPITVQVSSDMPGPDFVNNFLGFLKANDISEIVYTPAGLPQTVNTVNIINGLHWTTVKAGGATIIKVPPQFQ
jgi:hypothetical protein